jgi:hypothetical protein
LGAARRARRSVAPDRLARYDAWWPSELLVVELRRLRRRERLRPAADKLLAAISTIKIESSSVQRASRLEPLEIRTLDTIHLEADSQRKSRGTIEPC